MINVGEMIFLFPLKMWHVALLILVLFTLIISEKQTSKLKKSFTVSPRLLFFLLLPS